MIVGEAPGAKEIEQGSPFVGLSGKLINQALEKNNINRKELYITNVFTTRPPNNDVKFFFESIKKAQALGIELDLYGYHKFKGKYLKANFKPEVDRLFKEINSFAPKVILALGSTATWALTGQDEKISQLRGTPLHRDNYIVIPTYHPSGVMRNRSLLDVWQTDIKTAYEKAVQ